MILTSFSKTLVMTSQENLQQQLSTRLSGCVACTPTPLSPAARIELEHCMTDLSIINIKEKSGIGKDREIVLMGFYITRKD